MTDKEKYSASEIVIELQAAREWFTIHGRNTNTAIIGTCDRAINLINRQKAEIERLKAEDEMAEGYARALIEKTEEEVEVAKAEAVKEFAERLKNLDVDTYYSYASIVYELSEDDIDNLVKEMVGEG